MIEPLPNLLERLYDSDSLIYHSDTEFYYNKDFDEDLLNDIQSKSFQIYNGTYRYNEDWDSPKIYLVGRGKTCGKKIFKVEGFQPYMYLDNDKGEYKTYLGNKVTKVILKTKPKVVADLRKLRERIGSNIPYEGDILFVRRFLCDTYDFFKPTEHIEPKVCIYDVETNFPANNNMISFSINGYDGYLYHCSKYQEPNRYSLILDAYTKLIEYDIVANWNVEFDIKKLQGDLAPFTIALEPMRMGYTLSKPEYIKKLSVDYNRFSVNISTNILDALIEYDFLKHEDGVLKKGSRDLDTRLSFFMTPIDLIPFAKKMYGKEIPGRWSLDNAGYRLCGCGKYPISTKYVKDLGEDELMTYNCYHPDTDILTEDGWVNIREFVSKRMTTRVATLNPKTDKVEYHLPIRYIKNKCYCNMFIQDGRYINLQVTQNHNMWVRRNGKDKFEFIKAKHLPKVVEYRRDFPYDNLEKKYFILPEYKKEYIQRNKRPYFKTKPQLKLKMDNWLEFLGWYIAEGCVNKLYGQIYISQEKSISYRNEIINVIKSLGFSPSINQKEIYFSDLRIAKYLRQLGSSHDKYIPVELKQLSKRQLNILLLSIVKGDGHINENNTIKSLTTVSKQLADDVQEIAMKCGYNANMHKSHDWYVVTFCQNTRLQDFSTPRVNHPNDMRRLEYYPGYVYCVEVQNNLIMTRFNYRPVWCGNSIDTIVPEVIDNYLGAIDCHVILAWSLQSQIPEMELTAVVNDIALLREYHKDGIVLPSRPPWKKIKKKTGEYAYKAAEPEANPGVYDNIIAYDLHSAYATAVLAVNASCESKDINGKHEAPNGVRFNDNYSTFIRALKNLLEDREPIKDNLKNLPKGSSEWTTNKNIDFALKTSVAALSHGMFGWANSRTKDYEVADAITSTVRGVLDTIKEFVDSVGCKWVYCHTDSVYVNAPKNSANKLLVKINEKIKEYCSDKGYTLIPRLDYKGFYPKAYIHSPARNVLVDEDGKWHTTGMSYMRSETPEPLANIEKELIAEKLKGVSNEELIIKLRGLIYQLQNVDTVDLGIIKPLTKPISQYGRKLQDGSKGGIPYHISALILSGKEYGFKVKKGEKFRVLPIISNEFEGVRVIRRKVVYMAYPVDEDLPEMFEVDWERYLKSNLFGKVCNLVDMTPKQLENEVMNEIMKERMYKEVS